MGVKETGQTRGSALRDGCQAGSSDLKRRHRTHLSKTKQNVRVDITLGTAGVAARTTGRQVSEDESLSDQQYIEFTVVDGPQTKPTITAEGEGWVLRKLDKAKLRDSHEKQRRRPSQKCSRGQDPQALVDFAVAAITTARRVIKLNEKDATAK